MVYRTNPIEVDDLGVSLFLGNIQLNPILGYCLMLASSSLHRKCGRYNGILGDWDNVENQDS